MLKINIHIDDEQRESIKDIYGRNDYDTVNNVVHNIIDRYLNAKHFDPELNMKKINEYKICEFCKEKSKHRRMIDIDGTNLIECCSVCENCGLGYPTLK